MADRTQIEGMINELYGARQRNDPKGSCAHLHRDCTFRIVGHSDLGHITSPINGRDAAESIMEGLCATWDFSDFRTISVHVDGDTAYCHRKGTLRHGPTGQSFDTELIDKITFRDGQIVDFAEFVDTYRVAQILGLPRG